MRCALAMCLLLLLAAAQALRVTVIGGTGFVGSRVCQILVAKGADVTSVSKTGRVPEWAAKEAWSREVKWSAVDLLDGTDAAIDAAIGSPESVVSCLGVVDPSPEILKRGNGLANVNAFDAAKRAGVRRVVYVSVASEVAECEESWLPFAQAEFSA